MSRRRLATPSSACSASILTQVLSYLKLKATDIRLLHEETCKALIMAANYPWAG